MPAEGHTVVVKGDFRRFDENGCVFLQLAARSGDHLHAIASGIEIRYGDLIVEGSRPNGILSLHGRCLGDVQTIYHIMVAGHFVVHRYGKGARIDTSGTVGVQGECRIRCRPNGIEIHCVMVSQ